MSGWISAQPPAIRQVLPSLVPKVDADGNEVGGVPSALHQAPLGTYLGWNVARGGFFRGRNVGFAGGFIPFARTQASAPTRATRGRRSKSGTATTPGTSRRSRPPRSGWWNSASCSPTTRPGSSVRRRRAMSSAAAGANDGGGRNRSGHERGRPHLGQLTQPPVRVRAAAVPGREVAVFRFETGIVKVHFHASLKGGTPMTRPSEKDGRVSRRDFVKAVGAMATVSIVPRHVLGGCRPARRPATS